jgi:putative flippase GtrA
MKKIWELYKKHREVISYLFWGGVAFVLSMVLFWVFINKLGMGEVTANTVDWIIVVIFAFFTNKLFVFRSRAGSVSGLGREFVSFIIARLFTLVLENAIIWLGCKKMGYDSELGSLIVKFIGQVVVIVTNYILSKLWIFRKPKDKAAKQQGEIADYGENVTDPAE